MGARRKAPTSTASRTAPAAAETQALRRRMRSILRVLAQLYPDARISLDYAGPFQLYVATVLSAQCTDARVNQVTPKLFAAYPDAAAMAAAPRARIEALIRSTGFFRNKAKSIQEAARAIVADFGGEVPGTMEALLTLPGVGRKTANVILGNAFDTPGITVDTHVGRLSRRLGLTIHQDPVKVEFDLMALAPRTQWTLLSHRLILHGRTVCSARNPNCNACKLLRYCPEGASRTSLTTRSKQSR